MCCNYVIKKGSNVVLSSDVFTVRGRCKVLGKELIIQEGNVLHYIYCNA
jgi:autotransporter translocation and assembly factor TamB